MVDEGEASAMPLQPGTRLGPYSVTAKIGEGGMGEVYRAHDTNLDRDVAIKVPARRLSTRHLPRPDTEGLYGLTLTHSLDTGVFPVVRVLRRGVLETPCRRRNEFQASDGLSSA